MAAALETALGVDLEWIEPRAPSFTGDFFAGIERAACRRRPWAADRMVTVIWAAKEAVLKALRLGLTVDAREVICLPEEGFAAGFGRQPTVDGWKPFRVLRAPGPPGPAFSGLWRAHGDFVMTVALRPPPRLRSVA